MRPPGFPLIDLTPLLVFTAVMIVTYVFVGWLHDLASARRRRITKRAEVQLSLLLFRPDVEAAQAANRLGGAPRNLLLDMVWSSGSPATSAATPTGACAPSW